MPTPPTQHEVERYSTAARVIRVLSNRDTLDDGVHFNLELNARNCISFDLDITRIAYGVGALTDLHTCIRGVLLEWATETLQQHDGAVISRRSGKGA